MNKNDLKKLIVERITVEELLELEKKCRGGKKYIVNASIKKIQQEEILVVDIYKSGWLVSGQVYPEYTVYMSKEDYITKTFYHEWKTASIKHILGIDSYSWNYNKGGSIMIFSDEAHIVLENFLDKKIDANSLMLELIYAQTEIREIKLKKQHKKITDKIDEVMNKIGEVPEGFVEFVDYKGFYFSNYIYYRYSRKKEKEGYCTHCRNDVLLENIKNGKEVTCPKCETLCIGKSIIKSKTVKDHTRVELIDRFEEGIIVRTFNCSKEYEDYRSPKISINEIRRTVLENKNSLLELRKTARDYEWGIFKQREVRWCNREGWYSEVPAVTYSKNLKEVLKDTVWKYCGIEIMAEKVGQKVPVRSFLYRYSENYGYEDLIKHNLFNLVESLTGQNQITVTKGKVIHEELQLDKERFRMLININGGINALKILRSASVRNIKLTEEQVNFIVENEITLESFEKITKYMTAYKMFKYIRSQVGEFGGNFRNAMIDYKDYIYDCLELQFNIKDDYVLFPRSLAKRHRETRLLIKIENSKEYEEDIKRIKAQIGSKYEFEDNTFKVIYPGTTAEIIKEGGELDHCVGGYIKSVIDRKTNILFVRVKNEIDKSYFTLEVNKDKKIVQCRGYKNKDYSTDKTLGKFIEKYKNKVLKNIIMEGVENERISC